MNSKMNLIISFLVPIPSMIYFDIIFIGSWPQIQFNSAHASLQSLYNWLFTAITAQLVPSEIGVMSCIYEIM